MKNVFRFLLLVCLLHFGISLVHAQWSQTNGLSGRKVNEIITFGANLFAGTNGGVFRSTDSGANWTQVNNGLTDTMIVALAISGTNLFAGDWVNGVFRSTDNGANWTQVNSGMTDTFISDLLISGTTLFAGTADGGGIFRSTNNGTNWAEITTGLGSHDGIVLALSGSDILLGDDDCKIFRSTNDGTNWIQISAGVTDAYISSLVVSGSNLFAGTGRGVFLSADNGTTWTQVNSGLTDTSVNALTLSGTGLFAGTQGGVFHSSNNGASWTNVSTGLTDLFVTSLLVSGTELLAGTKISGVFRELLSALPAELVSFTASSKLSNVELKWRTATEINNFGFEVERKSLPNPHLTEEGIKEWGRIGFVEGNGTTNAPHDYSFTDNSIASGKHCYRLKQIDRDGKFAYSQEVEFTVGSVPSEFTLMQNYPNPFNPSTRIEFTVPQDGRAILNIYDMLGRNVATLFDGEAEAGRSLQTTFDGSLLAGGIYFSKLQFNGKQMSRKMLMLK